MEQTLSCPVVCTYVHHHEDTDSTLAELSSKLTDDMYDNVLAQHACDVTGIM